MRAPKHTQWTLYRSEWNEKCRCMPEFCIYHTGHACNIEKGCVANRVLLIMTHKTLLCAAINFDRHRAL